MASGSPEEPRPEGTAPASAARLTSWKEIAACLGTTERTVQRWEKTEGLPVHRHLHSKRGTVYAFQHELEAWRASRRHATNVVAPGPLALLWQRGRRWVPAAGVLLVLAAVPLWRSNPPERTALPPLEAVPFTTYPGRERQPTISPDGRFVAFSWDGMNQENRDIYVKPVDGGDLLRLTSDPAAETDPVWSPDGKSLAFLRAVGVDRAQVWIVTVPGVERLVVGRPLDIPSAFEWFYLSRLAWSPDGKSLIIPEQDSNRASIGLCLLSIDTGQKQTLTSPPATDLGDSDPAFSPNGDSLAFVRTSSSFLSELYVISLPGSASAPRPEPRRLTSQHRWVGGAVWTPDGREIVSSIGEVFNRSLFRISVPSQGAATAPPIKISGASWTTFYAFAISWTSRRLLYAREDRDVDIWRLPIAGAPGGAPDVEQTPAQVQLASRFLSSTLGDLFPQYSPDGQRVVFMSHRSGTPEIWVANSDGLNPRQISATGGGMKGVPRWSPDGNHIVFDARVEGLSHVFVMNASGGEPRRLTHGRAENIVPSWSRDGHWVYFVSRRTGAPQIWRVPAAGGEPLQVTRNGAFGGFESFDRRYLYFAKSPENTTLWKVPIAGGAETQVLDSLDNFANFVVTELGIFFSPRIAANSPPSIRFFSFVTGRSTLVAAMPMPLELGLTVSPDGASILYTQIERQGSDLMLVENFRLH